MSADKHKSRKLEHIGIALAYDVDHPGGCAKFFDSVMLIHAALPMLSLSEVDLRTEFLGHSIAAPLMISGMTGGHPGVLRINEALGRLAGELGIPIGTGSMRPAVEDGASSAVLETYKVIRRAAREVPVIGNIGAVNLTPASIKRLADLAHDLELDGIAVHLNAAQEAVQPEGDVDFGPQILERMVELRDTTKLPVIVKEVGNGISMEVAGTLYRQGFRLFDVAGACGTDWVKVEKYRGRESEKSRVANVIAGWGIPTPASVVEVRHAAPDSTIIASGGVWDGLRAAKSIALGADLVAVAKPVLKALSEGGFESAKSYLTTYLMSLKTAMFLTGSRTVRDLRRKPVVILNPLLEYLTQRGINVKEYLEITRQKA